MSLLCKLGFHRWDSRTRFLNSYLYRDYMRCQRPDCKYEEWMLVNQDIIPELLPVRDVSD